jgi:putative restriction endonuclease
MRARIERYRRRPGDALDDYTIGCIVLAQPFFFPETDWISVPPDWKPNIVQGRTYDLTREPGRALYEALEAALASGNRAGVPAVHDRPPPEDRYGAPALVAPRLGQGAFRLLVTDAYARRCSVSGERVLPVLEAAHIRPYAAGGEHRVENGLLLRSDLHTLFDRGYMTVTPELRLEVSRRIREEFDNGRDYYVLHGRRIHPPASPRYRPTRENLASHNDHVFRG